MRCDIEKKENSIQAQTIVQLFLDVCIILSSMGGALWVRMDFQFGGIDTVFLQSLGKYAGINIVCTLLVFRGFRLYNSLWRYAGMIELRNIVYAVTGSAVLQVVGMRLLHVSMPRSYPVLYLLLLFFLTGFSRFIWRILPERIQETEQKPDTKPDTIRTMIVGAGEAGNMLLKELVGSSHLNRKIVCIIDDDVTKIGTYLHGVPVAGTVKQIPLFAERYGVKEIIVAIPSASSPEKKKILESCSRAVGCNVLTLPGIYQIINGDVHVSMLRKIEINDLLGREPVDLRMETIMRYVKGKTVLVTGGGGSIGSEICRQIAGYAPRTLILFDIYENSAYDIRGELLYQYPNLDLQVLIGSVRNEKRVNTIFSTYRPELVFHAAAHKHVPLMEDSPNEAIKNNVLGTWNVAKAADAYHAKKMVLISTDKAVRPTNIMGASKRVCELIVQSFAQTSKTEYAAVRFGNVLGSNGSVVPLFQKQIAHGGPVTVTHPDIIRYFMTIPEAVHLVLQCGALAEGGEIFILDMGEPVKILDLAENMIRLSGLEPGKDIPITFTGLRPGEKLYEELLISLDNLKTTENKQIFVAQPAPVDAECTQRFVRKLVQDAFAESDHIREEVQRLVPEYTPERTETQSAQQPVSIRKDKANVYAAQ
ncbi:MAG: nucleoside-diphosphate sugar epimerase/dehydratase [Eubacteriales bacterium]|nr:nucleoside-diphosphate sugar epimerase/dehydratase [Eubacteriales bacterium]